MSSLYFTPIAFAAALDSSVVNSPLGQLDQAIDDVLAGNLSFRRINFGTPLTRTISSGAIARTRSYHTLIPESGLTDTLTDITGGVRGDELNLEINDASYTITIEHSTGNIELSSGQSLTLNSLNQTLRLWYNGTNWVDAGGSVGLAADFVRIVPYTVLTGSDADIRIPASGSFPTAYSELEILIELLSDKATSFDTGLIRFNGDSGNNYNQEQLVLNGGTVADTQTANQAQITTNSIVPGADTTNRLATLRLTIPGYARTNRHKNGVMIHDVMQADTAASFAYIATHFLWKSTAVITHLNITPNTGPNFVAGSAYAVWGKR